MINRKRMLKKIAAAEIEAAAKAGGSLKSLLVPLITLPLSAATIVTIPLISEAIRTAHLRRKQEAAYAIANKLFEKELQGYPETEKRLFFHTFRTLSPTLASDPLLVGTFLKQTLAMRAIDPVLINQLREEQTLDKLLRVHTPTFAQETAKALIQASFKPEIWQHLAGT
jgi:hypothetical protein